MSIPGTVEAEVSEVVKGVNAIGHILNEAFTDLVDHPLTDIADNLAGLRLDIRHLTDAIRKEKL